MLEQSPECRRAAAFCDLTNAMKIRSLESLAWTGCSAPAGRGRPVSDAMSLLLIPLHDASAQIPETVTESRKFILLNMKVRAIRVSTMDVYLQSDSSAKIKPQDKVTHLPMKLRAAIIGI